MPVTVHSRGYGHNPKSIGGSFPQRSQRGSRSLPVKLAGPFIRTGTFLFGPLFLDMVARLRALFGLTED